MYKNDIYEILENKLLAKDVYKMILKGETKYIKAPGQFINLKINGCYLRRPISISDYDENTITIIYKIFGKGTEIMSRVFQEYYEYTFLKDSKAKDNLDYSNTLNEPYHWKDINLVERTVNNVIDLFRAEFGLKPLDRDINNLDDFIRKTSTIAETFNNI